MYLSNRGITWDDFNIMEFPNIFSSLVVTSVMALLEQGDQVDTQLIPPTSVVNVAAEITTLNASGASVLWGLRVKGRI